MEQGGGPLAEDGAGTPQLVDLLDAGKSQVLERILLHTGASGPELCRTVGSTCSAMHEFVCGRPALWHGYELRLHIEPLAPYITDTIEQPIVHKEQLRAVLRHVYVRFTMSKLPPVLFASAWPQLRTLRLTGCQGACSMTYCGMEALVGSTPLLEELTLERCRIADDEQRSKKACDWLLQSCWRHVRTVALYDCGPEPAWCVAMQTVDLRSLHVRTGGWRPARRGYTCVYCEHDRIYGPQSSPGLQLPYYSVVGGGGEATPGGAMHGSVALLR